MAIGDGGGGELKCTIANEITRLNGSSIAAAKDIRPIINRDRKSARDTTKAAYNPLREHFRDTNDVWTSRSIKIEFVHRTHFEHSGTSYFHWSKLVSVRRGKYLDYQNNNKSNVWWWSRQGNRSNSRKSLLTICHLNKHTFPGIQVTFVLIYFG